MRSPGMPKLGVVLVLAMTACGAPDEVALSAWAVRLARPSQSALQARVIADRIASVDPLDAAWGAYLAGEADMTAMAESIAGLSQDGPLLAATALDALACLGGKLPDTLLRELTKADDMTVMAVALQEPAAHREMIFERFAAAHARLPDVIDAGDSSPEVVSWRAYANALTWLRDRNFAATLLASLETSIAIEVVSTGDSIVGYGCRCGASSFSSCAGFVSPAFTAVPPVGRWSILGADADDCVVLLPGPTDVCLARVEGPIQEGIRERALTGLPLRQWVSSIGHDAALAVLDDPSEENDMEEGNEAPDGAEEIDVDDPIDDIATETPPVEAREACPVEATVADDEVSAVASVLNDEIITYLSNLQGEALAFEGRLSVRHVWTGELAYRERVEDRRRRIRAAHTNLGRALADAYLLPDGYQPRPPNIPLRVADYRTCGATTVVPRL